jgi:hypothetical protein
MNPHVCTFQRYILVHDLAQTQFRGVLLHILTIQDINAIITTTERLNRDIYEEIRELSTYILTYNKMGSHNKIRTDTRDRLTKTEDMNKAICKCIKIHAPAEKGRIVLNDTDFKVGPSDQIPDLKDPPLQAQGLNQATLLTEKNLPTGSTQGL